MKHQRPEREVTGGACPTVGRHMQLRHVGHGWLPRAVGTWGEGGALTAAPRNHVFQWTRKAEAQRGARGNMQWPPAVRGPDPWNAFSRISTVCLGRHVKHLDSIDLWSGGVPERDLQDTEPPDSEANQPAPACGDLSPWSQDICSRGTALRIAPSRPSPCSLTPQDRSLA